MSGLPHSKLVVDFFGVGVEALSRDGAEVGEFLVTFGEEPVDFSLID